MTVREQNILKAVFGCFVGLITVAPIIFFAGNTVFASDAELKVVTDSVASIRSDQSDTRHDIADLRREMAENKRATCAGLTPSQKQVAAVCP